MPPAKKNAKGKPKRKAPAVKAPPAKRSLARYAVPVGGILAAGAILRGLQDAGYLDQWATGDTPMPDVNDPARPPPQVVAANAVAPMAQALLNPVVGAPLAAGTIDGILGLIGGGPTAATPAVYAPAMNGTMIPITPQFMPDSVVRKRRRGHDDDDDEPEGKYFRPVPPDRAKRGRDSDDDDDEPEGKQLRY